MTDALDPRVESPSHAIARIAERVGRAALGIGLEPVELHRAYGRVLAEPLQADRDSPPYDHSAMDGYAVRCADVAHGRMLPVLGESRPGAAAPEMPAVRGCIRIATGSARPIGSDAVVRREDVLEHPGEAPGTVACITIGDGVVPREGDHWRLRGENARAGAVLIEPGSVIDAATAATLAACGAVRPSVRCRVRVAILTTGDEVVPIEASPKPEQIRNSNATALVTLVASRPWLEVVRLEHVADELPGLETALATSIAEHDAVLLTGGVSMGHRDLVRAAIESQRGEILFHRLPQRPGRPMLAAIAESRGRPVPLFGLPGNPLSALVTARRIVLPALAAIAGLHLTPPRMVTVSSDDDAPAPLWRFRLARLESDGTAMPLSVRSSGDIAGAGASDGFVEIAPGERIERDRRYPFFCWSD